MLVPKNEPFSIIELIDKIPLEKTGIRNSLFPLRSGSTNAQLNTNIQIECIETWGIFKFLFIYLSLNYFILFF